MICKYIHSGASRGPRDRPGRAEYLQPDGAGRHRRTVTASACAHRGSSRAIARRHGLIGANIVSVSIVATAAVRSSANGSRADRCRSHTVAPIAVAAITAPIAVAPIACAAHRNSAAASRSSNCDRTAAVTAATPIGTSAAPSLGIIGDQAGDEQNESGKRSENIAEHDRNLSTNSPSPPKLRRSRHGRLM